MALRIAATAVGLAAAAPAFAPIHSIVSGEFLAADTVSVTFKSGDSASFHFCDGKVDRIDFKVLDKSYPISLAGCQPIEAVHAETAVLSWGSEQDRRATGTFTLMVRFGAADSIQFGEFPQLQITFVNGKPATLLAGHWTAPNSSFWSPLCSGA